MNRGALELLRKDPNSEDHFGNFKPIILLRAEFKILAQVLTTKSILVVGDLVGEEQICTIHGNFHFMRYIIENVAKEQGTSWALINLDQSKSFDRINHLYQAAVLKAVGFEFIFRGWIVAMHRNICFIVSMINHF